MVHHAEWAIRNNYIPFVNLFDLICISDYHKDIVLTKYKLMIKHAYIVAEASRLQASLISKTIVDNALKAIAQHIDEASELGLYSTSVRFEKLNSSNEDEVISTLQSQGYDVKVAHKGGAGSYFEITWVNVVAPKTSQNNVPTPTFKNSTTCEISIKEITPDEYQQVVTIFNSKDSKSYRIDVWREDNTDNLFCGQITDLSENRYTYSETAPIYYKNKYKYPEYPEATTQPVDFIIKLIYNKLLNELERLHNLHPIENS